ncbi:unnamed protein product, partial [Polarella glacialis]
RRIASPGEAERPRGEFWELPPRREADDRLSELGCEAAGLRSKLQELEAALRQEKRMREEAEWKQRVAGSESSQLRVELRELQELLQKERHSARLTLERQESLEGELRLVTESFRKLQSENMGAIQVEGKAELALAELAECQMQNLELREEVQNFGRWQASRAQLAE